MEKINYKAMKNLDYDQRFEIERATETGKMNIEDINYLIENCSHIDSNCMSTIIDGCVLARSKDESIMRTIKIYVGCLDDREQMDYKKVKCLVYNTVKRLSENTITWYAKTKEIVDTKADYVMSALLEGVSPKVFDEFVLSFNDYNAAQINQICKCFIAEKRGLMPHSILKEVISPRIMASDIRRVRNSFEKINHCIYGLNMELEKIKSYKKVVINIRNI